MNFKDKSFRDALNAWEDPENVFYQGDASNPHPLYRKPGNAKQQPDPRMAKTMIGPVDQNAQTMRPAPQTQNNSSDVTGIIADLNKKMAEMQAALQQLQSQFAVNWQIPSQQNQ